MYKRMKCGFDGARESITMHVRENDTDHFEDRFLQQVGEQYNALIEFFYVQSLLPTNDSYSNGRHFNDCT
jgi:ribosomal protein S15P/S13E